VNLPYRAGRTAKSSIRHVGAGKGLFLVRSAEGFGDCERASFAIFPVAEVQAGVVLDVLPILGWAGARRGLSVASGRLCRMSLEATR
jgi:hypothetical protein